MFRHLALAVLLTLSAAWAAQPQEFVTDPQSPVLRELARVPLPDEPKFGAGPLVNPGKTYYVSLKGDDKNDGRSWQTAWRTVTRGVKALAAGDTLLIGEGEYPDTILSINTHTAQLGAPGRPIRIFAAPRSRVVVTSASRLADFRPLPGHKDVIALGLSEHVAV